MPRLPGIESVTRVSTDGLRLPALRAPAVDPTGAALEDFGPALTKFGKSLGDFAKKREAVKAAKDAAALRELDGDLTKLRTEISDTPPPDGSEDRGPDEPEPMKLRLEAYDQVAADRLEKFGDVSVRGQAESIVAEGRKALELRASIDGHNRDLGSIPTMLESTLDTVRATAARQPNMLEVSRERGLNALRETAKVLGWSDDVLRAHEQSFDRELFVGVIQGRIARGEGRGVLESLRDPEMKELFDDATIADLTQEAEARHGSEVAAILSGLDIHGERIARTGVGVEGLAEQAATTLPPEQHKTFLARERVSQSAHDFEKKFARKPRTVLEAELETSFPGELASEEDQETFGALRDKASAMFLERERDPAAVAGRDPVVEGLREAGRTEEASALALEIQNQMEIPAAQRRLLTNAEAQSKAAELNKMPAVMRAQALAAEKEGDEKQFLRMVAELSQQGLDRPAQALAAVIGNVSLSERLVTALTIGRPGLREGFSREEQSALTDAVSAVLDRIAEEKGIDARSFRFAVEDLAFLAFKQTGDAQTAAEDAAVLFANQFQTLAPQGNADETLSGGSGDDTLTQGQGTDELLNGAPQAQPGNEQEGRLEPPISGATERVEVPFSGTPGTEVDGSPQDLPSTIQQFGDEFNKHARGVLGPAYEPAVGLLRIVELLSPVADVKDMMEGSRETTEGIRNLDPVRVAKGMSLMIGGFATLALPGSASQMAKMVDETVSRAKAALNDLGADAATAGRASVRPDENTIKESTEIIRAEVARSSGEVKDLTGDIANDEFAKKIKERPDYDPTLQIHPPYVSGTKVHDIEATGTEGEYVRVIYPDEEGKLTASGRWLMRADKFNEIVKQPNARKVLRDRFALPDIPTHFSRVSVPKGEVLRVGITNGHPEWGGGGAVQYEAICGPDKDWFKETEEITESINR